MGQNVHRNLTRRLTISYSGKTCTEDIDVYKEQPVPKLLTCITAKCYSNAVGKYFSNAIGYADMKDVTEQFTSLLHISVRFKDLNCNEFLNRVFTK
jgi:hypothetical protein